MTTTQAPQQAAVFGAPASVNSQPLHAAHETLPPQQLRQRACTELLRQAAQRAGLLGAEDVPDNEGVPSEQASQAIEALLAQALHIPEPDEAACRRYHASHLARYRVGERVHARHILLAVTPGVDVQALRRRAETVLLEARCHGSDTPSPDGFAELARQFSNCPSAAEGGDLGWLEARDCAPEFARELFGLLDVGVLPRLVHSRFGLHVVEVLQRETGQDPAFEQVRSAVAQALRQQSYITALRQYLQLLAGQAQIHGVDLEAADTPLVQ